MKKQNFSEMLAFYYHTGREEQHAALALVSWEAGTKMGLDMQEVD